MQDQFAAENHAGKSRGPAVPAWLSRICHPALTGGIKQCRDKARLAGVLRRLERSFSELAIKTRLPIAETISRKIGVPDPNGWTGEPLHTLFAPAETEI